MADGVYQKGVLRRASMEYFTELHLSDLPFVEGIIFSSDGHLISVEKNDGRFTVALKPASKFMVPKRDLVLNVHLCQESDENRQRQGEKLKIFVLERLLNKYELHDGEVVLVKQIEPFPLERVVIAVSSEEEYLWSQKFLATILLNCLSSGPFIVRENDEFYLPNDQENYAASSRKKKIAEILALKCEPVLQGCVTPDTSLVITKLNEAEVLSRSEHNETNSEELSDNLLDNYLVSDFTRHHSETLPIIDLCTDTTHKLCVDVRDHRMGSEENLSCNRLFVSLSTLIDLKLFNGSWVKIETNNSQDYANHQLEDFHSSKAGLPLESSYNIRECRVVQLIATTSKNKSENTFIGHDIECIYPLANGSEIIEDGVGYMSPLLFFNLFGKTSITDSQDQVIYISPVHNTTILGNEQSGDTDSKIWQPPFATEANVTLVHSPGLKAGDSFDGALAEYFKVPRVLTVGDIFYVHWDWQGNFDARKSLNSNDDERLRNLVVYFKVTKLVCVQGETKSCFVDVKHSSLYQRGSIHSYVPTALASCVHWKSQYWDSRPCYWEQISPAGLQPHVDSLHNIVKPYLDSSKQQLLSSCGILLCGPAGSGKRTVAMATSKRLNLHTLSINCHELIGESIAATEARIKNVFQRAIFCSPCILLLQSIHALGKDKEGHDDEPRIATTLFDCVCGLKVASDWPVVVIATTSSPNDVTSAVFSCFVHELKLEAPSESQRRDMLSGLAAMTAIGGDVSFDQLAKRTAGLVLADFVALFSYATSVATKRLINRVTEGPGFGAETGSPSWFPRKLEEHLRVFGVKLCMKDFEDSLEILQSSLSDAIGAPKIPSVQWDDVGGLAEVKAEILDTVQLPLQHPELFAAGLRRSGVLLYGPPGTGKTLLAKAVATECSLNFLSVKGPELINMYVGQSEQNVREVFTRAQSARPCVIFFDELDSLAPNRGRSGDSGGVMDRVVSQLLAELDGLHKACDVFVIGATNRPDLLDPALLRPSRFDKLLYLGVSEDQKSQFNILRALTRKFSLHPDLRLENVVALCPPNLTGADFYALCSDAMLNSVKSKIDLLEQGKADPSLESDEILVTEEDFRKALDALVPSVSLQELKRYKDLQRQFTMANNMNSK
ncbi:peroxisomal ATPase PEX6-like [Montipora foliosa]|uniref:peroxisomal ATPase PEX6-like n=1 Tax=Montipora foliosa TaxID=591990 RepID=UPI0035F1FBBA